MSAKYLVVLTISLLPSNFFVSGMFQEILTDIGAERHRDVNTCYFPSTTTVASSYKSFPSKELIAREIHSGRISCRISVKVRLVFDHYKLRTLCLYRDKKPNGIFEPTSYLSLDGLKLPIEDIYSQVQPVAGFVLSEPNSVVQGYIIKNKFYGTVRMFDKYRSYHIVFYLEPTSSVQMYSPGSTLHETKGSNAVLFEYVSTVPGSHWELCSPVSSENDQRHHLVGEDVVEEEPKDSGVVQTETKVPKVTKPEVTTSSTDKSKPIVTTKLTTMITTSETTMTTTTTAAATTTTTAAPTNATTETSSTETTSSETMPTETTSTETTSTETTSTKTESTETTSAETTSTETTSTETTSLNSTGVQTTYPQVNLTSGKIYSVFSTEVTTHGLTQFSPVIIDQLSHSTEAYRNRADNMEEYATQFTSPPYQKPVPYSRKYKKRKKLRGTTDQTNAGQEIAMTIEGVVLSTQRAIIGPKHSTVVIYYEDDDSEIQSRLLRTRTTVTAATTNELKTETDLDILKWSLSTDGVANFTRNVTEIEEERLTREFIASTEFQEEHNTSGVEGLNSSGTIGQGLPSNFVPSTEANVLGTSDQPEQHTRDNFLSTDRGETEEGVTRPTQKQKKSTPSRTSFPLQFHPSTEATPGSTSAALLHSTEILRMQTQNTSTLKSSGNSSASEVLPPNSNETKEEVRNLNVFKENETDAVVTNTPTTTESTESSVFKTTPYHSTRPTARAVIKTATMKNEVPADLPKIPASEKVYQSTPYHSTRPTAPTVVKTASKQNEVPKDLPKITVLKNMYESTPYHSTPPTARHAVKGMITLTKVVHSTLPQTPPVHSTLGYTVKNRKTEGTIDENVALLNYNTTITNKDLQSVSRYETTTPEATTLLRTTLGPIHSTELIRPLHSTDVSDSQREFIGSNTNTTQSSSVSPSTAKNRTTPPLIVENSTVSTKATTTSKVSEAIIPLSLIHSTELFLPVHSTEPSPSPNKVPDVENHEGNQTRKKKRSIDLNSFFGDNLLKDDDVQETLDFVSGLSTSDVFDLRRSSALTCSLCLWIQPHFAESFGLSGGMLTGVAEVVDMVNFLNWIFRAVDFNQDGYPENIGFTISKILLTDDVSLEKTENRARRKRWIDNNRDYIEEGPGDSLAQLMQKIEELGGDEMSYEQRRFGRKTDFEDLSDYYDPDKLTEEREDTKMTRKEAEVNLNNFSRDIKSLPATLALEILAPQLLKKLTGCCAILGFIYHDLTPAVAATTQRGLCSDKNVGIISGMLNKQKIGKYDVIRGIMHTLGHLFGAAHDNPTDVECTDENLSQFLNPFPLYPIHQLNVGLRPNSHKFSPCAVDQMTMFLASNGASCLNQKDGIFCGNGIVEEGEDCDCGSPTECSLNYPCCGERGSLRKCRITVGKKKRCPRGLNK